MSFLFPDRCYFCGTLLGDSKLLICNDCISSIPVITGECCKVCGRESSACDCKAGDFAFDRNISLMRYEGPAAKLVKRMKFNKLPQLTDFMGRELSLLLKRELKDTDIDYVTFVPMNGIKELKRGFNQAELIAVNIADNLGLDVKRTLKKKFTLKSQKSLDKKSRMKSVRGKFISTTNCINKNVLLVDDVFTTGATVSECAYVLKEAGAVNVYTATFAITYKK